MSGHLIALAALLVTFGPALAQEPSFDGLEAGAPAARKENPAARDRRACLGVQQTLAGAIEMYNLDHNSRIDRLDAALLRTLIVKGYLQRLPEDPGWGPNTAHHYVVVSTGSGISCLVHGSDPSQPLTEEQSCFLEQKHLAGAIEMYNLDNNSRIDRLDAAFLRLLVEKGYLERMPENPGHYFVTPAGNGITCSVHGQPGDRGHKQACLSRQRTIAGAVEMYNLDNNTRLDRLDRQTLTQLVRKGYLQSMPEDPGQGPGSFVNYSLTTTGTGVTCQVHGSGSR